MPIQAQGPDGVVHEFPDGTPDAVVSKAIASHYASTPALDKYQQAALDDYNKAKAARAPVDGMIGHGLGRKILQGATFGGADEVLAGLQTPLEMIKRGTFNPVEAYNYAKAAENLDLQHATDKTGALGTAAEIAGGIGSGTGLAKAGATLVKAGQSFLPRVGAMMGEGAAYGGLTGALNGEGSDRIGEAAKGAALGAGVGAAIPLVGGAIGTAAAPIASNIMARIDPAGSARARLARGLQESGKSADDVGRAVQEAAAQGQPVFTVADALGNPGQRLMSTVTRAPGEGRTAAVDFLDSRQAGQGRRVSSQLADALAAPDTAAQRISSLTTARDAAADADYGALRQKLGTAPMWGNDLQELTSRPSVRSAIGDVADTAAERGYSVQNPFIKQADGTLALPQGTTPNFTFWDTVKRGIDKQIAKDPTNRDLVQTKNKLVSILDQMAPDYAAARAPFRAASQAIEAVDTGKAAAMRGRAEDTIPAFQGMHPGEQSAFRAGYADPLIEQASNAAPGVNKVRPLMGDGPQAELGAFSVPGRGQTLLDQLQRENQMFETRAAAMGGSKTADNLADQAHAGIDPRILSNLLTGHFGAAATNLMHGASNGLTGNTPAVRHELAKLLMSRGVDPQLGQMLNTVQGQLASKQALAAALMRGAAQGEGEAVGQRR